MFLLVLVTCVTLEQQTMCHEFPRKMEYASKDSCQIAAAMEKGRYNSRMQRRTWAKYRWECRNDVKTALNTAKIPSR